MTSQTQDLKWIISDVQNGIRTSHATLDSAWGFALVRRYENIRNCEYLAYVGVVVNGNHVSDMNFGGNLPAAVEFTQHPFRPLNPGDYWYGAEIQAR